MAGAAFAGGYPERAQMALAAGCDMVLVCNAPGAATEVLDQLNPSWLTFERHQRLKELRGFSAPDLATLQSTPEWQTTHDELMRLTDE